MGPVSLSPPCCSLACIVPRIWSAPVQFTPPRQSPVGVAESREVPRRGTSGLLCSLAGAHYELNKSFGSRHTPFLKQNSMAQIWGRADEVWGCWFRKKGGASYSRLETKAFQRPARSGHFGPLPANPGHLGAVPRANTPLHRCP